MKMLEPKDRYYQVKDAAKQLRISERRVLQFISDGRLKAVRFGKSWAIPESELRQFAQTPRSTGRPKLRF